MSLLTAVAVDCIIPRGKNRDINFTIYDEDTNNVYDLTGHTVYMSLSRSRVTEVSLLYKEATIISAVGGQVTFKFSPADTKDLMVRSYDADILLKDATDNEWPAFQGTVAIVASMPLPEEE